MLAPFGVKVAGSSKPVRQGRLDVSCDASELRLTVSPAAAAAVEAAAARLKKEPPTDCVPAPAAAPEPAAPWAQPSAVAAVLRGYARGRPSRGRPSSCTAQPHRSCCNSTPASRARPLRRGARGGEGDGADGDGDDSRTARSRWRRRSRRWCCWRQRWAARTPLGPCSLCAAPAIRRRRVTAARSRAPLGLAPGAVPAVEVAEVEALCALRAGPAARRRPPRLGRRLGRGGGGGGGKGAGGGRAARASVDAACGRGRRHRVRRGGSARLGVDAAAVARLGRGGAVTARHSRSGRSPASDDRRLELELCAGAAEVVAAGAELERRASVASLRLRSRCVGDGEWRATWLSSRRRRERAELRLPPRAGSGRAWSLCRRRAGGRRQARRRARATEGGRRRDHRRGGAVARAVAAAVAPARAPTRRRRRRSRGATVTPSFADIKRFRRRRAPTSRWRRRPS